MKRYFAPKEFSREREQKKRFKMRQKSRHVFFSWKISYTKKKGAEGDEKCLILVATNFIFFHHHISTGLFSSSRAALPFFYEKKRFVTLWWNGMYTITITTDMKFHFKNNAFGTTTSVLSWNIFFLLCMLPRWRRYENDLE